MYTGGQIPFFLFLDLSTNPLALPGLIVDPIAVPQIYILMQHPVDQAS